MISGEIIEVDFGATQMHVRVSYSYNGTVVEKVLYLADDSADAIIKQAIIDQAPYFDTVAIDAAVALKVVQDDKAAAVFKMKAVEVPLPEVEVTAKA